MADRQKNLSHPDKTLELIPSPRENFRRGLERAGLPHIRFHDLRATYLLRQGTHPKIVQERKRLGHSTLAFTVAEYSHVLPGMQEQAARNLAERILG